MRYHAATAMALCLFATDLAAQVAPPPADRPVEQTQAPEDKATGPGPDTAAPAPAPPAPAAPDADAAPRHDRRQARQAAQVGRQRAARA